MKIKLKKDQILPNNWKQCGHTEEEWKSLNDGGSIEVNKVPSLIEIYVDIEKSTSPPKVKKGDK